MNAQRIDTESCRSGDVGRIFTLHIELLTERRNWRGDNFFREVFVIDLRDIVDAEAMLAHRGVNVFAAQLNAQDLGTRMLALRIEFHIVLEVLLVICWEGKLME